MLEVQAQDQDREQLERLYDALNGNGWFNKDRWKTSAFLDTWYGVVKLDVTQTGVRILDLDGTPGNPAFNSISGGNGLSGTLPELQLPFLEQLSLSDNSGIHEKLPSLSGMPKLIHLHLQKCMLSGRLENQFENNNDLFEISLQENKFEGNIPEALFKKSRLERLFLHKNRLKGRIPAISLIRLKILDIRQNQFTFGDILPFYNINKGKLEQFEYEKQDTIRIPPLMPAPIGFPFSIDLGIDYEVVDNFYNWSKNGKAEETIPGTPILKFTKISSANEGTYTCLITNKILNNLTLVTQKIDLKTCTPSILRIDETLCPNESRTINAKTYDVIQPKDTIYLRGKASNGCDSIIIVQLQFQNVKWLDSSICAGSSFIFNGNSVNTKGLHKFLKMRTNSAQCDSMYLVNLNVIDETQKYGEAQTDIDQTLCTPNYTLLGNPAPTATNVEGKWQERGGNGLVGVAGENTINLDLKPGLNTFEWVFSTLMCPNFSKDEINLFLESAPILVDDIVEVTIGELGDTIMPLRNDSFSFIRDKIISWLNPPGLDEGIFMLEQDGEKFTFFTDIPKPRELILYYTVQSDACSWLKDTATVLLRIVPKRNPEANPPNVITPNGDGYNDTYFVPQLVDSFEENRNNRFIVYSNSKQRVYEVNDYRNDWGGWDQNNKPLPSGWYQFYFQGGKNVPIRGEVLILR